MTIDRVLSTSRPAFTEGEAAQIARDEFRVEGAAREVDSERDQAFLMDGPRPAVMKISNAAEDPARLDMEALAAQRVANIEPDLPVALPWLIGDTYRVEVRRGDDRHWARMYDRLAGRTGFPAATLTDRAVRDWGTMAARVGRALRGFWHPLSARVMLWDAQHALQLRPMLDSVRDAEARELVAAALDRYEQVVTPVWPTLRAQFIHTDLVASNVLVDDEGSVTGIIDFGDASWSALVVDLIAVLRTVTEGRDGDEFFRTARLAIDGYEKVTQLEPIERRILGELLAARMCASIVVPASREAQYADPDALMPSIRSNGVRTLKLFGEVGWEQVARQLGGREPGVGWTVPDLAKRRAQTLGPALTNPTYSEPLHLVRGEGVWLFDADGRRYLDAYNNVPVVGHAHPRVVAAVARQAQRLISNVRYLHETAYEVAARLTASTGGVMDAVMFVNSGSEANDLAWRISRAVTGGTGGIATDFAYHGITSAIADLTPEKWATGKEPAHVKSWRPTDRLRGFDGSLDDFDAAIAALDAVGHKPAAAIMDAVLTSDGIIALDPSLAGQLVQRTHDAGAIWIADEVQSGFGRTGVAMWGYQHLRIEPDIVTLGKPMGNGIPVAAVLTRRDLAERFSQHDWFSTFGGNHVAMAAALAVLEVIEDERILDNAKVVGDYVGSQLREWASSREEVGEVRQVGLAIGVEIVKPGTTDPDPARAKQIVEGLRQAGILVGRTGRHENSLKIRPPLVFAKENADQLIETLDSLH